MLVSDSHPHDDLSIAVVGMAVRFPGAPTLDDFWRNLVEGRESIREFTRSELLAAGVGTAMLDHPDAVFRHGILDDAHAFDPAFFGITLRDGELLNPQHRMLLELTYLALEHAGYACVGPQDESSRIGVFVGSGRNRFEQRLLGDLESTDAAGAARIIYGSQADFLATTLSNKLGLCGPSINVQTACSSSLVAVHMACQSLLTGESDLAVAGGVSIRCLDAPGYVWQPGGILSRSGRCRPFSALADGTVGGDGAGIVVLRRLADARAAGDSIMAILRGSAVNNDGHRKVGFTAPSREGQARVIAQALRAADLDPGSLSLVEAHGTATALGDAIEFAALKDALGTGSARCALTSAKANIGHLDAAAGIAGLAKTVLSLMHRTIPAQPGFESPNVNCDFAATRFYVPQTNAPWPVGPDGRRLAGVSSFGIGGTNVHVIVEGVAQAQEDEGPGRAQILLSSGKTEDAARRNLFAVVAAAGPVASERIARTLALRRPHFDWRTFAVSTGASLQTGMHVVPAMMRSKGAARPGVCLVFPGQGTVTWAELHALLGLDGAYRREFDDCLALLTEATGVDVRASLGRRPDDTNELPLLAHGLEQALHVAVQVSLVRHLEAHGIVIAAVCGHSIGEFSAAVVAGVMPLAGALRVLVHRSRLCATVGAGAMVVIAQDPRLELDVWMLRGLSAAAFNAVGLVTLSGPTQVVEELQAWAAERDISFRRLPVGTAYHSTMMVPIADAFADRMRSVPLSEPRLEFVSTVTGRVESGTFTRPGHWARHLCEPVQFLESVTHLLSESPHRLFVEVGPGAGLCRLLEAHSGWMGGADRLAVETRNPRRDLPADAQFLEALGRLWQAGCPVRWQERHAPPGLPASRPGYQFDRLGGDRNAPLPARVSISTRSRVAGEAEGVGLGVASRKLDVVDAASPQPSASAVVELVCTLLGVSDIDTSRSFFALGGSSLVGLQLVARIRTHFTREISLADLQVAESITAFAGLVARRALASVDRAPLTAPTTTSPVMPGTTRTTIAPLSHLQRRLWLLDQFEPGTSSYNVPLLKRVVGNVDVPKLAESLRALAERHETLRSRFVTLEGEPAQAIEPVAPIPFDSRDFRGTGDAEQRAALFIEQETHKPFALAVGPPWRCVLARIGDGQWMLLFVLHHIVTDGASMHILWRDVRAIYDARMRGVQAELPKLRIQYADFAVSQRPDQARLAEIRDYWLQQATNWPVPVQLTAADGDVEAAAPQFGRLSARLDAAGAERLNQACRAAEVSVFAGVMAAVALAIHVCTGRTDIAIGFPASQRESPDVEELIGFFVNTIALRVQLDDVGNGDPSALLRRIHDDIQQALRHGDIAYDEVVQLARRQEMEPGRPRDLFNVSVAMGVGGTPAPDSGEGERFGPAHATSLPVDMDMAQFDLGFFIACDAKGMGIILQFNRASCPLPRSGELVAAVVDALLRLGATAGDSGSASAPVAEAPADRFVFE